MPKGFKMAGFDVENPHIHGHIVQGRVRSLLLIALAAHVGGRMKSAIKSEQPDERNHPVAPRRGFARHIPLLVILAVAVVGFFTLGDYLTFETLRDNREALLGWRDTQIIGRWPRFSWRSTS